MAAWKLRVLGEVSLSGVEGVLPLSGAKEVLTLERKTAAVLAYLSLEGQASRSRLAGLLWPDSDETAARNNLVQTLRRLKKATGQELVVGEDQLKLSADLEVDAVQLNVLAFTGAYQELLKLYGDFLPYDYDHLPEFSEWLLLEREKLGSLRREALTSLIKQHELESQYDTALTYAQQLLYRDEIDEESYRLMMRLHYLAGNRAEAIKTFERCKGVLQKELNIEPSLETQKLAADIGVGLLELSPFQPKKAILPLSVLRPPMLIGREQEWEQLEQFWQEGKIIFIYGEAGSGKSRLMLDFAASKGAYALVDPRPGDEAVLYSTYARNLRRFIEQYPQEPLESWVGSELSRLLPELGPAPPPPMKDETDKLRLFEAARWVTLRHHGLGARAVVMDDMQFMDAASLAISNFISRSMPSAPSDGLRFLYAFRDNEISVQQRSTIQNLVDSGAAVLVEVKPLSPDQVGQLIESLGVPQFLDRSERLSRYTGGNPFFILETLKSLLESGHDPSRFPVPSRVGVLIQKRLDRLHPASLKLARVAAVAGSDFSPQLAENILNLDALELAEGFAELERLQILRGNAFAHDLIYEATLAGVPVPIRTLLHGRVAAWLEQTSANPANIARHYLAAGDEAKAISHLLSAAHGAVAIYNLKEAAQLFLQAAHLHETHGEEERTFEALYSAAHLLVSFDTAHSERILLKLFSLAHSDEQKAKAHLAKCETMLALGRASDAEQAAHQGLYCARAIEHGHLETALLLVLGSALWNGAKIEESRRALEQAISLSQARHDSNHLAQARYLLGAYLFESHSFAEGNEQLLQAERLFVELNQPREQMSVISQLSINDIKQGRVREALARLLDAQHLLHNLNYVIADYIDHQQVLASCWLHLTDYQQALACIDDAIEKSATTRVSFVGVLHSTRSVILAELGYLEGARKELELALEWPDYSTYHQFMVLINQLRVEQREGHVPGAFLADLESKMAALQGSLYSRCFFLNLKAATTTGEGTLLLSMEALDLAQRYQLGGLQIAAHVRCARAFFDLGKLGPAAQHSGSAVNLITNYTPQSLTLGEVFLTQYQIRSGMKEASAKLWLEKAFAWLIDIANNKVPPQYRHSFLTRNPTNKAILDEAKRVGLEPPAV